MSNSCRPLLKSYMQCIRNTELYLKNPDDNKLEDYSGDPTVRRECDKEGRIYYECKANLLNPNSRIRGNVALRRSRAEDMS